jgi:hypothetical protein
VAVYYLARTIWIVRIDCMETLREDGLVAVLGREGDSS